MQGIPYESDDSGGKPFSDSDHIQSGDGRCSLGNQQPKISNAGDSITIHPAGELAYDYYLWLAKSYDDPERDHDIKIPHQYI